MLKLQYYYYILTIASVLILALIVLLNNAKKLTNRIYFFFSCFMLLWLSSQFAADIANDSYISLQFIRVTVFSSIYIGAFFIFLIDSLISDSKPNKRLWLLMSLLAVVLTPFAFMGSTVESVKLQQWGVEAQYGATYNIFLAYSVFIVVAALYLAFFKNTQKTSRAKAQIRLIFLGIFITALINILSNFILLQFGLPQQYGVAFGILSVLFIVGFTSFAIIRHKLFDIRAVVARALTYLLVIATISIVYGLTAFVFVGSLVFKDTNLSFTQQTFYALLAVLLAFTFQPIRRFFERITDKIFFRDKYDAQELINSVGRILTAEIRLSVLAKEVTKVIEEQMRVNKVDIVVVNDKNIYYQARVLRKDSSELELKDLQELGKPLLVADDMTSGDRKDIMDKYGLRVSITLRTSEEFVGYLLLGEKLSGDIYNEQDLAVLRIIANELAVAVQNAKAYTEIQQFNKTLQAKVVAATRKLRKANEDLKELDQAKDEFISMASHQLRTPLTTAKGYVSMILEGDFGKIQPAMKEPLEQALDSSNRMAGLVSDLLNVSRMEAGRFFIDPTDVDLNSEVPAEVTQLQTLAASKSVKLIYDKPAKPVPIMKLDLDKTRQVIMNLADNAVHYSAPPNGGGVVHVSLAHEGQDVVFKVVDNGIGVPEAQQKKLFKKFFRAGNAQNTRPDGTGLGLYLVKRVVEDQGGELIFESKEGKGSTFGFRMPVKNKIKPNSKASEKLNKAQYSPVPGAIQPTQEEKDAAAKEQEDADKKDASAKEAKK